MTTSNEHNNAPAVPQGEPVAWMVYGNYTRQPFGMLSSAEAYMRGLLKSDPDGGYHIRPLRYATPAPAPAQEVGLTDGWISVGDRLPDGELGYPAIEFYNEDLRNPTRQVIGIYRDGDWFSGGHQFSNVTYWKPLTPAPLAALRAKGGK